MRAAERSLVDDLSLIDIRDGLYWQRDGSVGLLFRVTPHDEPSLAEDDFTSIALQADNVWSAMPEGSSYQWIVCVDHRDAVRRIERALPPIPNEGATAQLLEEMRQYRVRDLLAPPADGVGTLIQDRRHFFTASFTPLAWRRNNSRLGQWLRGLKGLVSGAAAHRSFDRAYDEVLLETASFERRVMTQLQQQGLALRRATTQEMVGCVYEFLNPRAARSVQVEDLSDRSRWARDGLTTSVVSVLPYLGDTSPVWSAHDDDMLVRREYLEVGDRFVSVISLKELPDSTTPGMTTPLLRLPRSQYRVVYRVDIPSAGVELAALKARAAMAEGMRLENMLVESRRPDVHADAVANQSSEAMKKMMVSAQRIFGISLQVVLYEPSTAALEEAVEETLGAMSRAHGLRGHRETYLLKEAWLGCLPGAPVIVERRRRALTPVATDFMPAWDARTGSGSIPLLTPDGSVVMYDPFGASNFNILISGVPGSGKSVLAQVLLSGYEMAAAGQGTPPPQVFILDNGASYERYMKLREDGRYVRFDFATPPGVDVFAWDPIVEPVEEHISRLSQLLLDLLRVDRSQEERFERKKAAVEAALQQVYEGGLERSFAGFAGALGAMPEGVELATSLHPYAEGKFKGLFTPNPALELTPGVRAVCYDFKGLEQHADFGYVALRLVVYQVRRHAARARLRGQRSFLLIDESWALMDPRTSGAATGGHGAAFLASSLRMGRKEGLSVIALSQGLADFEGSDYGSAILSNSSTRFVGQPGASGMEAVTRLLRLSERQAVQVRQLARTPRYHEFLLLQDDGGSRVVRIPLDAFSRWVFTTSPRDRDRIASVAVSHPELSLLDQMRLLCGEEGSCLV